MPVYYNEFNPKSAAMLRQLIKDGLIADGIVDERSITEVKADELKGFTQCHFFAGIGGWSVALRKAMWSDDRPVWTGSCPCQPFSTAGKQKGKEDERHLWPVWFNLIRECKPSIVFGEQVSSAISHGWLDGVRTNMEAEGYALGAAVLPACSVNANHKRDRLWFVADTGCSLQQGGIKQGTDDVETGKQYAHINQRPSSDGNVGNSEHDGQHGCSLAGSNETPVFGCAEGKDGTGQSTRAGDTGALPCGTLADSTSERLEGSSREELQGGSARPTGTSINTKAGNWSDYDWIICGDGKARRIPTIECDVHGLVDGLQPRSPYEYADSYAIVSTEKIKGRAALLHGLGNAIVPEVAARFIKATIQGEIK